MMELIEPAVRFIERSLKIDPGYIPALLNRAKALQAQERYSDVQTVCQQILEINPAEEEAWKHWACSLHLTHQTREALLLVKRWKERLPDSLQAHLLEGELLCQQGQFNEAIPCFGEALRIDPSAGKAYAHLSGVMIKLHHHEVALKYIEKALGIDPESISYCCRKAQILWLMARWEEASEWFGKAYLMRPESATLFLNQHLTLPSIPKSAKEIEAARRTFNRGLELAEHNSSLKLDFLDEAIPHTFQLAYHNKEDRLLLERYISLMRYLSDPLLTMWQEEDPEPETNATQANRSRLRIGFLSKNFSGHSNTIAFEGLIRFLDRQRFEVVLIHAAKAARDSVSESLDAVCQQSVQLSPDYADSFKILRQLDLDILYFTDLGMHAYEFILPFFRSATLQITGWGIPHTSGIREIDYYISADKLEPIGSENNYTEKLVRLPGGLPCSFLAAGLNFTPLPRDYFFLPPDATLVGCLQSLHKIHPDFDHLMEQIAQRNPDVIFVFVEDRIEERTAAFLERLSVTAPSVRDRCLTLALMTRGEYHALCHCIDLLLDPIYYGCGITFFEACFVGTPIITLEGENLRSKVVASGYREMALEDPPVATTYSAYVDIATQLISDPERIDQLRESILSTKHRLFDRLDYVRNFEEFCLQAIREKTNSLSKESFEYSGSSHDI